MNDRSSTLTASSSQTAIMSDIAPQAESSTSGNTSALSNAMAGAQLQDNDISPDTNASLEVLKTFLVDTATALSSNASAEPTIPKLGKEPASLMTLAGELRKQIYRDYFAPQGNALDGQGERRIHHIHPDDVDVIRVGNTDTLVPWATPSSGSLLNVNLLFTCKQVYHEAKHVFLGERLVQVQMHGQFDLYVAQALQQATRLELCVAWPTSSCPARPRQFFEILEAREDLKEFTFQIGKDIRGIHDGDSSV